MAIKIRRTEDLQAIHDLDRQTFPKDYPTLDRDKTHVWWVAELNGNPVGFIGLAIGEKQAAVTRVGVVEESRGAGLQKRLLRVALMYARRQGFAAVATYVLVTNIPSLRNLLAVGFKPLRTSRQLAALFLELERRLT